LYRYAWVKMIAPSLVPNAAADEPPQFSVAGNFTAQYPCMRGQAMLGGATATAIIKDLRITPVTVSGKWFCNNNASGTPLLSLKGFRQKTMRLTDTASMGSLDIALDVYKTTGSSETHFGYAFKGSLTGFSRDHRASSSNEGAALGMDVKDINTWSLDMGSETENAHASGLVLRDDNEVPALGDHTGCSRAQGKRLEYLDRHDVKCPTGSFMDSFKFTPAGCRRNDFRYEFGCTDVVQKYGLWDGRTCKNYRTGGNEINGQTLQFLDRHEVKCGAHKGLVQFKLRSGHKDGRYEFRCCGLANNRPLWTHRCKLRWTSCSEGAYKGLEYLDRHNMQCGRDEVITSFQVGL
jgi:hypothetical protein